VSAEEIDGEGGAPARHLGVADCRERESLGERCGLEVLGDRLLLASEGRGGVPEVVGGGTPTATIKARWSFDGRPLREGEEEEGAGRRRVSARRTRREGQEARGRGRSVGEAVAGAATGWCSAGGRSGTTLTGGVPPVGESVREGEVGVRRRDLMGCGSVVGRKLSGPRKDKEEGKKRADCVGLKGGREREGLVSSSF
jgi:hypothetical protein